MTLLRTSTHLPLRCSEISTLRVFDDIVVHCGTDEIMITSDAMFQTLSSAVLGGGFGIHHSLVNLKVDKNYNHNDPALDAAQRIAGLKLPIDSSVALMTAAVLSDGAVMIQQATPARPGILVVATAGLSNAAHALDSTEIPVGTTGRSAQIPLQPGTINLMCLIDGSLTESALAGCIITATEAKCAALQTLGVRSPGGHIATGTTSDAIVIAARQLSGSKLPAIEYMGLATPAGQALGRAVYHATQASAERNLHRMASTKEGTPS